MKKVFLFLLFAGLLSAVYAKNNNQTASGTEERELWVNTLIKIADPVLSNLADGTLKAKMPLEGLNNKRLWSAHLEAVGRTFCGIAPWLELGVDDSQEGQLRKKYIKLALKGLANAVDPSSPDYLDFGTPSSTFGRRSIPGTRTSTCP